MIMKDIWKKQEMKMKEINEKTFRDRGSGFVEISSYRLWENLR